MADDQGVKEPEGQSQEVATPATEQQLPAEVEVQGSAPDSGNSIENETSDDLGLPEDASERTRRRVQELLAERDAFKAKLEAQKVSGPVYPNAQSVAPAGSVPSRTDEYGNLNPAYLDYLEQKTQAAEARANQVFQSVSSSEESRQTQEAISAHPDLRINPELVKAARALMMDSLVYPESYDTGKPLTYKEAVDHIKEKFTGKAVKTETPEQETERITAKEQASLVAEGRPSQGVARELSQEEKSRLSIGTREGKMDAMVARLKNIPAE